MRITRARLETVRWAIAGDGAARGRTQRAAILVELVSEDGFIGLGEAAPLPGVSRDTLDDAEAALAVFIARVPLETRTEEIEGLTRDIASPSARFAAETALLDLVSRATKMPLSTLLGGSQASQSSAVVVDTPSAARLAVLAGARTLKIKVGADGGVDHVLAIHRAAPDATLRLDANCSWPRDRVASFVHALGELPIELIEEPCDDTLSLLAAPSAIPFALDETLATITRDDLARALRSPQLGALVIKPTLVGGAFATRDLAERASEAGKPVVITHCLEGPIGTAACAAIAIAFNDPTLAAGMAPHPALDAWPLRLLDVQPSRIRRGLEPGLGIERIHHLPSRVDAPLRIADLAEHLARGAVPTDLAVITPTRSLRFDDLRGTESGRPSQCTPELVATYARTILATPTLDTIRAIHAAFATGTPIALLHPKLSAAELDRQRALITETPVPRGTAVVLFTSGSTGQPRGVVISREAIDAAVAMSAANLGWRANDRWLLALPMAHAGGLSVVLRCRAARVPVMLLEGDWDRVRCSELLVDSTLASLVPTQLASLLDDPAWRPPATLRAVILGGAAATPTLLEAAAARGVPILTSYGLTETFGQIATAPRHHAGDPRAPLVPLPGVELVGGTRAEPARLRVRTPSLATMYLDGALIAPELATADLAFVEDGALHIVGRADDVIITGGENVHPIEIEAILSATTGVRAAVVFGISDDRWGQRVAAALAIDATFDEARAVASWRALLATHALPRELALVTALPLLANGKPDRRAAGLLPRRATAKT